MSITEVSNIPYDLRFETRLNTIAIQGTLWMTTDTGYIGLSRVHISTIIILLF